MRCLIDLVHGPDIIVTRLIFTPQHVFNHFLQVLVLSARLARSDVRFRVPNTIPISPATDVNNRSDAGLSMLGWLFFRRPLARII